MAPTGRNLSSPSSASSASAAVALLSVPCVRGLPSPTLDPGGPAAGMRTSLTKSTSGVIFSMKARSSLRLESTLDSSEFAFHTTMVLGSSGGTSSSVVFWRLSLVAPPGREKNCAMLIGWRFLVRREKALSRPRVALLARETWEFQGEKTSGLSAPFYTILYTSHHSLYILPGPQVN